VKNLSLAMVLFGAVLTSGAARADGTPHSTLYEGDYLFQGQRVVGDAGYYHLEMQTDGNLVLYAQSTAIWATGTNQLCVGWPFPTCAPQAARFATLQGDGNFVVYWKPGVSAWATNTPGGEASDTAQFWVQEDGNLVEYRWRGAQFVEWASNTAPGGEKLGSTLDVSTSITHIEDDVNLAGGDYKAADTNDPMQCGQ
jgi:hypothetical protein